MAIAILLTAFSPLVFADDPSWATPSDIQFQNIPVSDRIIPLGFSAEGVFSYILQQNSCYGPKGNDQRVTWNAVDLKSDEVIEQVNLGAEYPGVAAEEVFQKYGDFIEDRNSQYGITMMDSYQIATSSAIRSDKDALKIQTELVETVDGEDAVNPGYRKYRIMLESETKGMKTLGEIVSVYEQLRYWGYIMSPFEERIATLFISDFRGCDAFPQMRINIVGANLVHGFPLEDTRR